LKIAERLQMPGTVLKAATGFLDATEADAAHYVEELRQRIVDLETEKARVEKERKEFEESKQKELSTLTAQHKDEITKAEKKLERIVQEVSERASRELETVKDDSVKKFQKKLANVKAQAHSEINREKEKLQPKSPAHPTPRAAELRRPVVVGAEARVVSLGVTGTVMSIRGDEAEVLVGNIKMRRPIEDLEIVERAPIKLPPGVHLTVSTKELEKNEINLLGRRVDEAIDLVDKFLDDAFLAQMREVRIVHGTGTGALRQAILELLASHPHVGGFEAAVHAEGGRGVTIVTLRK
jgi:DNA mismatch repair protein MutS2